MSDAAQIQSKLEALGRNDFRAKFHLGPKERTILEGKGINTIRQHAADLIAKRLAPAAPPNDGKQTPWRGHPVFIGQHATATCCRSCLYKWHGLPPGRELTAEEQGYVVEVLCTWIKND